jgi:F420-dependent oxidoreductase-like protein
MQVWVFTEPHRGATYDTQLRFAQLAEECGFAGLVRADHYQAMGTGPGLPGPSDAWTTLAGLSRETTRIRLGVQMSPLTFRLPGPLAVTVAQVDQMSGGRIELGLGIGWYEREHRSYGIPFPPLAERFDMLAEQLEIVNGLWRTPVGARYSYHGKHYQLVDSPALPKPVQVPGPPVVVGGQGRRGPELAARYADEFNAVFMPVTEAAGQFRRVARAAQQAGRAGTGRAPLRLSLGVLVACGRTDAEARRRAEAMYEPGSALPQEDPVVGSPARVVDRIGEIAGIGADRVYLRLAEPSDLDHLALIGAQVLPQIAPTGDGTQPA